MSQLGRTEDEWVAALVAAARVGQVLDLAAGLRDEEIDFAATATWPASRRVPGSAIRQTLLSSELHADPRGLRLRGAHIIGEIDLRYAVVGCPLEIELSIFDTRLAWQDLSCGALRFRASRLRGLDLARATISGQLGLDGAHLNYPAGVALSLDRAEVKGGVFASGLTATGEVRAIGVTIGGQFDLDGAHLNYPARVALGLDEAEVRGGVFASGLTATGEVRAIGVTIGGQLDLGGAHLNNSKGTALALDGAEIKGGVFAPKLTTTGEVRADGVTIGGHLALQRAHLSNANGVALSLNGAEVKGWVLASQLTTTTEVRAIGATIGGQLDLEKAHLGNPGGSALTLDRAEIKGGVFAQKLTTTAAVRAIGATISGELDLREAQLSNPDGNALSLEGATIKAPFFLSPSKVEGGLGLQTARLSNLVSSSTGCLFDTLANAAGWQLGDVHGPLRTDRTVAARWLDAGASADFVPQPWHELANVYDRNGQPADARWMRYQAAKRTTRAAPRATRFLRHLYAALVGHGYYPLRAAVWLVVAVVLAGVMIGLNKSSFSPTDPSKAAIAASPHRPHNIPAADITAATPCPGPNIAPTYRCFNAGLYALDTVLPAAVTTGQAADWRPVNTGRATATWLPWALSALKIIAWLTTALLLAGITGILRKT